MSIHLFLLLNKTKEIEKLKIDENVKKQFILILSGKYFQALKQEILTIEAIENEQPYLAFEKNLISIISKKKTVDNETLHFLICGISSLLLFIQNNYTGPPLSNIPSHLLTLKKNPQVFSTLTDSTGRKQLSIDGELVYSKIRYPYHLILSKIIFQNLMSNSLINKEIPTLKWWYLRVLRVHQNILSYSSYTLRKTMFEIMDSLILKEEYLSPLEDDMKKEINCRLLLEMGMIYSMYLNTNKAKKCFESAKVVSGMYTELTGALGVRTKFQENALAQLILKAKSKMVFNEGKEIESNPKEVTLEENSVLLEKIKFNKEEKISEPNLHPIDQCIILSLCLDVKNNNPSGGLTTSEMFPYVNRVLLHPNNWMIFTMGLLMKCRLEKERPKTIERSVLQLNELVDQFTTEKKVNVDIRMKYFFCLNFPPFYKLKKELGERYISIGCFKSGLSIFEDLDLYQSIIDVLMVMGKVVKASILIEKRLEKDDKNPVLYCCLGEIKNDEKMFLKSWEVSNQTYARSMRNLGRFYVKKKMFKPSIEAFEKSLKLNPLYEDAWFLMGCSCMYVKEWKKAASAFTRFVQIKPNDAEAWTNLSSIYYRLGELKKSWTSLKQALKQCKTNPKIWHNFLLLSMDTKEYNEAINAINQICIIDRKMLNYKVIELLVNILHEKIQNEKEEDYSFLKRRLNMMFLKISEKITPVPIFWESYAFFLRITGDLEKEIETRKKHLRYVKVSGWNRVEEIFKRVCGAMKKMVETLKLEKDVSKRKESLIDVVPEIASIVERTVDFFENESYYKELIELRESLKKECGIK